MKIKYISFLVSVSLWGISAGAQGGNDPIAACKKALLDENPAAAESIAKRHIANPGTTQWEGYLCLGRAKSALGDREAAAEAFDAAQLAADTDGHRSAALILLGNVQLNLGRVDAAIATYRKTLRYAESPRSYRHAAHSRLSAALRIQGNMSDALFHAKESLDLAANDNERAEGYAALAALHSQRQAHDLAVEYQIKTVMLQRRSGEAHQVVESNIELGRIYLAARNYTQARKAMESAFSDLSGVDAPYWKSRVMILRGEIHAAEGALDKAASDFSEADALAATVDSDELKDEIERARLRLSR